MENRIISGNTILRGFHLPLCLVDTDCSVLDFNTRFSKVFLPNNSEMNSINIRDLVSEDQNPEFEERVAGIFADNETKPFEVSLMTAQNNSELFQITPQIVSDNSRLLVTLTFTELKQDDSSAKKISEIETNYNQLIQNSPVGMVILENGVIIQANQTLVETFEYKSVDDLLNKHILNFVDPDFIEIAKSRMKKLSNSDNDSVEAIEEKFVTKSGKVIDVLVAVHSISYNGKRAVQGYVYDITESKEMERNLRLSEEKFKKAFYTSPDAITISQVKDGLFVDVNEGFTKIVGYSREEAIGYSATELNIWYNPSDRERMVSSLMEKGIVNNFETKFRIRSGKVIYGLMSISIIVIEDEPCLLAITRDITALKETQIKLAESEERFRSLFENGNAVMMLVDPDSGKIVDANLAACNFYGYDYKYIVQKLYTTDINPFTDPEKQSQMRKSLLNKNEHYFYKHQLANGEVRDVEVYGAMVTISGRQLIYVLIHDISERRIAEEENRKLTQAVKQSPVSIIITDTKGNIEFVNEKFLSVTGYQRHEVIGRNPQIIKSGHTPVKQYEKLWNTILKGDTWKGELLNQSKTGEYFWESVVISPIRNTDNEIKHFLAVKEDITGEKEHEKSLIEAKEKAELSDKLKSEFLAQMSHEIRTPVNVILSFTSLLKSEFIDTVDDDVQTIFDSIENSGQRIIRTIDLIINMSEIQTGSYEPQRKDFDLISKILEPLIKEYKVLAEKKNLQLNFEADKNHTEVFLDEYSTYQIFANLIDNAIKYTEKGKISIKIFNDSSNRPTVEVCDTGVGISRKYLPDLFQPFTQEEQGYTRRYDGNGLGLAIVKKYCELNSAEIKVESQKGKGSKFTVKFYEDGILEKSNAM